jgi:hypothetical protein
MTEPKRPLFMAGGGGRVIGDAHARQLELWRKTMDRYEPGPDVEVYVQFQIGNLRYSGEAVPKHVIAVLTGKRKRLPAISKRWRPRRQQEIWSPSYVPQRQLTVQ